MCEQFMAKNTPTFGSYIQQLRLERQVGLRALARQLTISPTYLNDIEKDKRPAPKNDVLLDIADQLGADLETLYDLAGQSRDSIPPDIFNIMEKRTECIPLLRAINEYNLDESAIRDLTTNMIASNEKALIIAAGMGNRLQPLTEDKPKCMLDFGGKTLLQRQIEAYNACGITNIAVIRGYQKEKINYEGLRYYENTDYQNNNILGSLFYAEHELDGHIIISYSDILFESQVVQRLLQSDHDISIVVDIDWRGYYVGRIDHPIEEAENVIFDANNNVVQIGKILASEHDVHGEFIGMLRLSPKGAAVLKKHFHQAKTLHEGKSFQRATEFKKAYLTDMIQQMVDFGVSIHCVIIERGWKEIDTVEDYKNALREFKE